MKLFNMIHFKIKENLGFFCVCSESVTNTLFLSQAFLSSWKYAPRA